MAEFGFTVDLSNVEASESFSILPPGDYYAQIIQSEMRVSKAGTGKYLWLEYEILDGEFVGRKFWNNLNLLNPNSQTVEIAQRDLKAICAAIGVELSTSSDPLHFLPMLVKVKVKPGSGDYGPSNVVDGHKPTTAGAAPVQRPAATRPQATQAPAQGFTRNPAPRQVAPAANAGAPWEQARAARGH